MYTINTASNADVLKKQLTKCKIIQALQYHFRQCWICSELLPPYHLTFGVIHVIHCTKEPGELVQALMLWTEFRMCPLRNSLSPSVLPSKFRHSPSNYATPSLYGDRDSVVGISIRYGLDDLGIESRSDQPREPTSPLYNGYRVANGVQLHPTSPSV